MVVVYTASWVLPVSSPPIADGAVVVDGGTIVRVGRAADVLADGDNAADSHVELPDCALLPGFVNVHTHVELTLLRGLCEESDFFPWIRRLTRIKYECASEASFAIGARWGIVEALRGGTTTIGDASDRGVVLDAMIETGLRGIAYAELFGPDPRDAADRIGAYRGELEHSCARATERVRPGVSPHAPYTVSGALFIRAVELARELGLPLSIHAAESVAETDFVVRGVGPFADLLAGRGIAVTPRDVSPVRYLHDLGVLRAKPLLVHGIRTDSDDWELIGESGARLAHCPRSNAKLGHGIAPLSEWATRGIPLGLGTDSVVSNNACDMLSEARTMCLQQRARTDRPGPPPTARDALRIATLGGAEALGMSSEIGSLEVGKKADLIAVDLSAPAIRPVHDVETAIVFGASGRDVRLAVVDGRALLRDGRVETVDEEALRIEVDEHARALRAAAAELA